MERTEATNPTDAGPTQAPGDTPAAEAQPEPSQHPDFRSRGRARRRARFLRKARELAYRDLGGLVYNLHRFGQRNDALVLAKLATLGHIDDELRAIEAAIGDRQPVTVLREAGITACPRCAAIHGSEDRFCPNCGLPMSRHADLPVGGAPSDAAIAAPVQQPTATFPVQQPVTASHAAVGHQATAAFPADGAPTPPPGATGAPPGPATAQHAAVSPAAPGRSPAPPERVAAGAPRTATPEEQTEIIHPPAQEK